jgi:parallel beta-helix repeat protein
MRQTTLEALPQLDVTGFPQRPNNEFFECKPNTTDCTWPSLIIFVDGDTQISDIAIKITAIPATKPWFVFDSEITSLQDVVRIMGQYRTNASLVRVAVSGMADNNGGTNVANGVIFAGEFPRSETDLDYYFLTGTFSVTNSSFNTMLNGILADGFFTDSRLTIGGSPTAGNIFADLPYGIDLQGLGNSVVEVSHNTVATGTYASVLVMPWCCWVPTKPSLFLIHDNMVKPTGPYADGILLYDPTDPSSKWLYSLIYNNTVEAQDIGYGGISIFSTKGTTIINNKVSGNGADGIGIWDDTYAAVLSNDVTNFTAFPDLAQIVLDGTTTHSTVVCKTSKDTVMNQGADNKLSHCQEAGNGVKRQLSSRPSKLGSLPMLRRRPVGR